MKHFQNLCSLLYYNIDVFKKISKQTYLLLIILTIASFFRLYNLSGTNSASRLYPDEAINGNNASALDTVISRYFTENNGRGLVHKHPSCVHKIFRNNLYARLPSAHRYFDRFRIYLFATLFNNASLSIRIFTAISFWHINSFPHRIPGTMAPFFLVWALYFLLKSLTNPEEADFIEAQPPKYYHRFLRRLSQNLKGS